MGETLIQVNEYLDILFTYGPLWVYVVLFAACFVENLFPPFPGDSFIVVAGALIGLGRLDFWSTYLIVNFGGILSVMLMYHFGAKYGRQFFMRKNYKYFSAADIVGVEYRLSRWGAGILVASRFVVGFRSALAVASGIAEYPAPKMFFYSLLSYFAFTGLLMYIGSALADNFGVIEHYFKRYNQIVWPVLILALAIWIWYKFRSAREDNARDS